MESNAQLLKEIDNTMVKALFNLFKGAVVIAEDIVGRINKNEKSTSEDFKLLASYNSDNGVLLREFFKLNGIIETPVFTAHEKEITTILNGKTKEQIDAFMKKFKEIAAKMNKLLTEIQAR